MASEWTQTPACCGRPDLVRDERYETLSGPCPQRVVVCRGCDALWTEEWTVLWVGADSERDVFHYRRVTEDEAKARSTTRLR